MQHIQYKTGDATRPFAKGNKIIAHICNDVGAWGKGFVMAISNKWRAPERHYRSCFASEINHSLGDVQFIQVSNDTWIANIIGQKDICRDDDGNPPIRYDAVATGLQKIAKFATDINASVHMPRIGCGLAGGSWHKIEPLIKEHLSDKEIAVTVYDFC